MTDTYVNAQFCSTFEVQRTKGQTTFQIIHPNDKLMTLNDMYEIRVSS